MIEDPRPSTVARLAAKVLRTRWVVRAPITLYRAGLGFLFGHRLLMLEHLGRKSGLPRYVVLEVVDRDAGSYTIAAGFGERSEWLRNLDAHPEAYLSVGTSRRVPVVARRLTADEAAEALQNYAAIHPRAWAGLAPVFEQTLGEPIKESGTTLPMVRLTLTDAG
jgi:deazaflavin-dependent oxidoreductase (nitroreductase family)